MIQFFNVHDVDYPMLELLIKIHERGKYDDKKSNGVSEADVLNVSKRYYKTLKNQISTYSRITTLGEIADTPSYSQWGVVTSLATGSYTISTHGNTVIASQDIIESLNAMLSGSV